MKRKPALADRVDRLEDDMVEMKGNVSELKDEQHRQGEKLVSLDAKLDTLIEMGEEHGRMTRARMNSRTKIVTALLTAIGAVSGAIAAVLAGCS